MTPEQKSLRALKLNILKEIKSPLSIDNINKVMASAYTTMDNYAGKAVSNYRGPIGCKSGCSYCCHQAVWATEIETIYAAEMMRLNYAPEFISYLKAYLTDYVDQMSGVGFEEHYKRKEPCPLLHESMCQIYPARPTACRGVFSPDADLCNWEKNKSSQIPMLHEPYKLVADIRAALIAALYDKGLRSHQLNFISGLKIALCEPESGQRWLNGENVFEPAISQEVVENITLASRAATGDKAALKKFQRKF